MANVVDFVSWPKQQAIYYKVTSNGISFRVKMQYSNAAIGLFSSPGVKCGDCMVIFRSTTRCSIRTKESNGNISSSPQASWLPDQYNRFWLSWSNGQIKLGRDNDTIVSHKYTHTSKLKYVAFFTLRGDPVHWKIEVPPSLEIPRCKLISGGKTQWVPADMQLPDGAMIGGFEKETLYIVRAHHRGSLTPGKFVPSEGVGYIPWGGQANETSEFEVLCGHDCVWVKASEDKIPTNAIEGGFSEDHNERLYVGRASVNGHLIPGKVQPTHKVCYVPFQDREVAFKDYEILVAPSLLPAGAVGNVSRIKFMMNVSDDENDNNDDYYDDASPHFYHSDRDSD